LNPDYKVND
jgi:Proteolysis_6 C-terminal